MDNSKNILFLEINNKYFIFYICEKDINENFKVLYKLELPISGFEKNHVTSLEKSLNTIRENIIMIEQKFKQTFKEIILILEDFNPTFINLSGFKKLNGYQVLRENITYILNSLKSYVTEIESQKNILHIFNSKFNLDNKRIDNLPIGLYGDFYSHELAFILINKNDFKNLSNIFDKSNLKIKKIFIKNFIRGAAIIENYEGTETFFYIKIENKDSKIFYFENNSLKFEQSFNFGKDLIFKDVSKITALEINTIKEIIRDCKFEDEPLDNDLIKTDSNRIIKKKLIYEIISARVEEIFELMLFKNTNLNYYKKNSKTIYLEIDQRSEFGSFEKIFKKILLANDSLETKCLNVNLLDQHLLETANKLVHFGWKSEAIPITGTKKSIIARFFEAIFD